MLVMPGENRRGRTPSCAARALRRYGMRAPQTIKGSMTGRKFLAYV
jgi:hypothetical protein